MSTVQSIMQNRRQILLVANAERETPAIQQALEALASNGQEIRSVGPTEALPSLRRIAVEKSSIILLTVEEADAGELAILEDIKKDEQLRKLPVVVLGPPDSADLVDESFGLGAAGYMANPANPHELVAMVHAVGQYWSLSELPK